MPRLLFIGSEPACLEVVALSCRADDHSVVTATSLEAAVPLMEREAFDLVIVDVPAPLAFGLALIKAVKAAQRWSPLLAVSAQASVHARSQILAAGAQHFLAKPFRSRQLRAAVNEALSPAPALTQTVPAAPLDEHQARVFTAHAWGLVAW